MRRGYLALAGLAGIALYAFYPAAPTDPGIDPFQSASIGASASHEFAIANLESQSECIAVRGNAQSNRSLNFVPQPDCATVWPGLGEARNWTENEDGSVVLSKGDGEAVLTISPADGVDYEALDPDNAMVTVTRLR